MPVSIWFLRICDVSRWGVCWKISQGEPNNPLYLGSKQVATIHPLQLPLHFLHQANCIYVQQLDRQMQRYLTVLLV